MTNVPKVEGAARPDGPCSSTSELPARPIIEAYPLPMPTHLFGSLVDLGPGDHFLSDMGKRYYLFPMYSQWMPVIASPGSRTAGEGAKKLPRYWADMERTSSPGWSASSHRRAYLVISDEPTARSAGGLRGRACAANPIQTRAAQELWEALHSSAGQVDPNPGFSMTEKPQVVINDMDVSTYFNMMSRLMSDSAYPAPEDAPHHDQAGQAWIPKAGTPFDLSKPDVQRGAPEGSKDKLSKIIAQAENGASW